MRKLSLVVLPIACCLVIVLSLVLLIRSHSQFPRIQTVDAASHKNNIPRRLLKLTLTPIPTKVPTPTLKPSPTPTPKPTVTPTPRPTATPVPTSIPTAIPTQPASGTSLNDVQSYIMQRINEYRASQGKSSVMTDPNTCNFAQIRAQEITSNFNHDGFTNRINSHTLPYSSYHGITENIAMTSDYKEVVTMWVNSPEHAENMRADTPFVCVAQSGNCYAYEGWRP